MLLEIDDALIELYISDINEDDIAKVINEALWNHLQCLEKPANHD